MTLKRLLAVCAVGLLGLAAACGDSTNDPATGGDNDNADADAGDGTGGPADTGTGGGATDAGRTDATPVDRCEPPGRPYGTREGANFSPFDNVTYCDGAAFDFFSEEDGYCDASFTVIIRAAEWCRPCQLEAQEIGAGILDRFGPENVRFLTVLDQNQDFGPPDQEACESWESRYGLDRDGVDHRMLLDPGQEVSVYFPAGQDGYPGNVIIDSEGKIRKRIIGFSEELGALTSALDEFLAP